MRDDFSPEGMTTKELYEFYRDRAASFYAEARSAEGLAHYYKMRLEMPTPTATKEEKK